MMGWSHRRKALVCFMCAAMLCNPQAYCAVGALPAPGGRTQAREQLAVMQIELTPFRLVQFAAQGDLRTVNLLLLAGVRADEAEPVRGVTALHNAAANGHANIIDVLLKAGANVNAADNSGSTALMNASFYGQIQSVDTLLKNGARVDPVTQAGFGALEFAVMSGKLPLVKLLVAHRKSPELSGPALSSSLQLAHASGRADIAALLQQEARP